MKHLLSRLTNLCRAEWSYMLSCAGVVSVKHMPVFVSVEPADYCQLACPQCPVGMSNSGAASERKQHCLLSLTEFEHILSQVAPYAWTMQFFFQGEPLLNKDLPEMIRRAHEEGIYTIVSTNAQALTKEMAERLVAAGLNRIIVSMDGATQHSYEQYRVGGKLQKVLDGLRFMREAKQRHHATTTIELQCLLLRSNEHEWQLLRQHYREWGADKLSFKTAQFYDFYYGNPLMPSDKRYSRYSPTKNNNLSPITYHLKQKRWLRLWHKWFGLTPCRRLWTGCVITTTGSVLPCCFDKAAAHAYGSITNNQSPITNNLSPSLNPSLRIDTPDNGRQFIPLKMAALSYEGIFGHNGFDTAAIKAYFALMVTDIFAIATLVAVLIFIIWSHMVCFC